MNYLCQSTVLSLIWHISLSLSLTIPGFLHEDHVLLVSYQTEQRLFVAVLGVYVHTNLFQVPF